MSNYKEAPVSGSEYIRFNQINVVNPIGITPSITFAREKVIALQTREIIEPAGSVTIAYDPNKEIPIIDPATRQPTGQTATMQEAYAILYSAALQADEEAAQAELP